MNMYRYPRPAIFLPGDSRRAPAYARRNAARSDRRRASDPYAPDFTRSAWRRSEACQQAWRIGSRDWLHPGYRLYFGAAAVFARMVQMAGRAASSIRLAIARARDNLLQAALPG